MKFPKKIRHRGKVLATIYGRTDGNSGYRVTYSALGKRRMKHFSRYAEAKSWADKIVRELSAGSQVPLLSPGQANDAIGAFKVLQGFYEATGRRVSLHECAAQWCESALKLNGGHSIGEAVSGFLATTATVQRKPLSVAVADYLAARKHLGESKDGKRAKHSPVYEFNVAAWLNQFAGTFKSYSVSDLSKEDLNAYMKPFAGLSAKSRNDRRAVVKMFLRWCAAKDYLPQNHRLFEAVDFKTEAVETGDILFFTPKELRAMLEAAEPELLPVIALGGLAGLRREEIVRLEWGDVWRVAGKIEIGKAIAKGRKRRLVDVCAALGAWLEPYRNATGPVWPMKPDTMGERIEKLLDRAKVPARRNGLRHSFCSYHFAMHGNENLTAAEAGNSPAMLHLHYRALATAKEAAAWFDVAPAKADNVVAFNQAAQ